MENANCLNCNTYGVYDSKNILIIPCTNCAYNNNWKWNNKKCYGSQNGINEATPEKLAEIMYLLKYSCKKESYEKFAGKEGISLEQLCISELPPESCEYFKFLVKNNIEENDFGTIEKNDANLVEKMDNLKLSEFLNIDCDDFSDKTPPREAHAQVVILRQDDNGSFWVLLQRRSLNMFMPGYIGTVGGQRDKIDISSRETALREVEEETGLQCYSDWWKAGYLNYLVGPNKFAEGKNVDWFVINLPDRVEKIHDLELNWFAPSASNVYECADISDWLPYLRPGGLKMPTYWHEPFGHAWVKVKHLNRIAKIWRTLIPKDNSGKVRMMGGMCNKIKSAVWYVNSIKKLFRPLKFKR